MLGSRVGVRAQIGHPCLHTLGIEVHAVAVLISLRQESVVSDKAAGHVEILYAVALRRGSDPAVDLLDEFIRDVLVLVVRGDGRQRAADDLRVRALGLDGIDASVV